MRALEKTFLLNRNFFPTDGLRVTLTNKKEKLLSEGTGSGGGGGRGGAIKWGGGLIRVRGGLSLGGGTLIRDSRVVRKANIFKMRQLTC